MFLLKSLCVICLLNTVNDFLSSLLSCLCISSCCGFSNLCVLLCCSLSCCIHAALFVLATTVQRGGMLNVVTQFELFLAAGNCVATCRM